jgi:hypothetical protein
MDPNRAKCAVSNSQCVPPFPPIYWKSQGAPRADPGRRSASTPQASPLRGPAHHRNGSPRPARLGARFVRRPHAPPELEWLAPTGLLGCSLRPSTPRVPHIARPTLLFCLPPRDADSEAWSPMRYFAPPLRVAEASFPPSSPRPTRSQMHQRREGMYIWLTTHPMQIACSVGDEFGDAHWIERDKCICICLLESALGSEILGRE